MSLCPALFRCPALLLAAGISLLAQGPAGGIDANALSGLRARNIGPGAMGGRIASLDGVLEKDRVTLYVGAAAGGVWKSENGGTTFKPVFDKYCQSIGAIRIDPRDHARVWVGTGEGWVRNSVSVGDGIYLSTDAGDTWTRMGLPDSEHIAGIEVDPSDSQTVFAAAMGRLWSAGGERGFYKTSNGGRTWRRTLFVDENTGCSGLALDPKHPKVLFAAMWDYRRTAWSFRSGGPGSGLYRSADGGETWAKLTGDAKTGLPGGALGRIAVALAPSDPRIVYAAVESQEGGMYRSEDGGLTWSKRFTGSSVLARPFYFGAMFVDPKNPDRLYKMGYNTALSEDGAKTFTMIGNGTHGDHHALWIHPGNPEILFLGEDGGFFASEDRGASWRFHKNLPIGQFYHVSTDDARPYRVIGGLQDNSNWIGYGMGQLGNRHWRSLPSGDGFWAFIDPTDSEYAYAESQGGEINRFYLKTMTSQSIKPREAAGEPKFRFNWNTPIHLSRSDPGAIYMGAQYLFRSKDHGNTWERLSPDLTTNDPEKQKQEESGGLIPDNSSAENHCTIYSISESPRNGRVIWAGTDDGNLQVTRDAGKTWTNMMGHVPDLPKNTWVSWVEASPHAEGTAFAAFDGHTRGDMAPRIFRTTDFGVTWTPLATPDIHGFVHVIRQDPVKPNLLFVGTEAGLFLSLDSGTHWAPFKGGDFPPAPVRDLVIQPTEQDLVIATHGRGLWIIDDLTSLRALTPEATDRELALLPSLPAKDLDLGWDGWTTGQLDYTGEDKPGGAIVSYWQKKRHIFGELKAEILDSEGRVLRPLATSKRRGFNRMTWDRLLAPPRMPMGATPAMVQGPQALEGTYTLRLTKGKDVFTTAVVLLPDPQSLIKPQERKARYDATMRLYSLLELMAFEVDRVRELRDEARARAAQVKDEPLRGRLEALAALAETARGKYVPVKEVEGMPGEDRLREKAVEVYSAITGYQGPPSRDQLERIAALGVDVATGKEAIEAAIAKDLTALNEALAKAGLTPLPVLERGTWEARSASN